MSQEEKSVSFISPRFTCHLHLTASFRNALNASPIAAVFSGLAAFSRALTSADGCTSNNTQLHIAAPVCHPLPSRQTPVWLLPPVSCGTCPNTIHYGGCGQESPCRRPYNAEIRNPILQFCADNRQSQAGTKLTQRHIQMTASMRDTTITPPLLHPARLATAWRRFLPATVCYAHTERTGGKEWTAFE